MSGITNPAEEYFKNGLWAWDPAAGVWLKLIIDPLTNQLSVAVNNDAEVHQTAPADLAAGAHGWDGAAWHKLPMVWGYSGRYSERKREEDVTADDHYLTFALVPAGEVWVVTSYTAFCTTANPSWMSLGVIQEAVELAVALQVPVVADTLLAMSATLVLKAGDRLRTTFLGCAAGDDLRSDACGYKMKVAE